VACYEVLQGEPPVAARRTAVNDDKLYCSHIAHGLIFISC
jgi:hypothetical protein